MDERDSEQQGGAMTSRTRKTTEERRREAKRRTRPTFYRSAVTVRAKQPLKDWLDSLPNVPDVTLDQIHQKSTVYLIERFYSSEELEDLLAMVFQDVFKQELLNWAPYEAGGINTGDCDLFDEWFDVRFHAEFIDLEDEDPLLVDDL